MAVDVRGMTPLLQVFDMPTSLRFYRDVLGFEVVSTPGHGDNSDWVLLQRGSKADLMLNTAYEKDSRPPAPNPARVKHHEDTSLYFGCEDIDGSHAYLRSKGVEVTEPTVSHYGMRQMYLTDPDGYVLCFQWPTKE